MLAIITVPLILYTFSHVIKYFLNHDFNRCMKLYFKGILEFIPLLLNIFSVFVSSVLYAALKILIDKIFLVVLFIGFLGLFPISGITKWEEFNNFQGY